MNLSISNVGADFSTPWPYASLAAANPRIRGLSSLEFARLNDGFADLPPAWSWPQGGPETRVALARFRLDPCSEAKWMPPLLSSGYHGLDGGVSVEIDTEMGGGFRTWPAASMGTVHDSLLPIVRRGRELVSPGPRGERLDVYQLRLHVPADLPRATPLSIPGQARGVVVVLVADVVSSGNSRAGGRRLRRPLDALSWSTPSPAPSLAEVASPGIHDLLILAFRG
jgi:hypothetical protein